MGRVVAAAAAVATCPECGVGCETFAKRRRIASIDGPVDVEESVAHCPGCRRDFFPPPADARP